jgi:hypothetical protein
LIESMSYMFQVLFNYKWLHSKLSCMILNSVLTDFDDLLARDVELIPHEVIREVTLLADALRLASSVLVRHPDMLGPQVSRAPCGFICLLGHFNKSSLELRCAATFESTSTSEC